MRLSTRISSITTSPALAVDAKARALLLDGRPVINFADPEPDVDTPAHILEAAVAAVRAPSAHRRAPVGGLPELKAAIIDKTRRDSGLEVAPTQVLVTHGARQAAYNAFASILDPGDRVLLPCPWWPTFPEVIRLAGGVVDAVPTSAAHGYRPSIADLEAARTDRTTTLVLTSPHHPTGAVLSAAELAEIGSWAAAHDLWIVVDESREHFTNGNPAASLPVVAPQVADRCMVVNSVAATHAMPGWRVGWLLGPTDVVKAATELQSHATSSTTVVTQDAALAALTGPQDHVRAMAAAMTRRRQLLAELLDGIDGITCPVPEGGFHCWVDISGLLGIELHGTVADTPAQLAEVLLTESEVVTVPGECFGSPTHLAFAATAPSARIHEGVTRIRDFLTTART